MFFTQDDYKKIQQWLIKNSVKDTEFNEANIPFNGNEVVSIVQGSQNKKVLLKDLVSQIFNLGVSDFINITDKYDAPNINLEEAIRLIPSRARKEGQVITFLDMEDHWHIYQFKGVLNQWNVLDTWEDLFDWEKLIIDSILPDEEDLTKSEPDDNGNSYLSLKDREYNPEGFSGLGRVILRKNIVEIEDPIYCKVKKNVLYQDMFTYSNTIYEIRYDFDLNGQEITIPEDCVLDFKGGSLNNGTIVGSKTKINAPLSTIFKELLITGIWDVVEVYPEWFGAVKDTDSTDAFKKLMDSPFRRIRLTGFYIIRDIEIYNSCEFIGGGLRGITDENRNTRKMMHSNQYIDIIFDNVNFDGGCNSNPEKTIENNNIISFVNSKSIQFNHCKFHNFGQTINSNLAVEWAKREMYIVSIFESDNVIFDSCSIFENYGKIEQFIISSYSKKTTLQVHNCRCYNNKNAAGLFLVLGLRHSNFINNCFLDNGRTFIQMLSDNVYVDNNIFSGTTSRGVTSEALGAYYPTQNIIITNNEFSDCDEGGINTGIYDISIKNNKITNCDKNRGSIIIQGIIRQETGELTEEAVKAALPYIESKRDYPAHINIEGNIIYDMNVKDNSYSIRINNSQYIDGFGVIESVSIKNNIVNMNKNISKTPIYVFEGTIENLKIHSNIINASLYKDCYIDIRAIVNSISITDNTFNSIDHFKNIVRLNTSTAKIDNIVFDRNILRKAITSTIITSAYVGGIRNIISLKDNETLGADYFINNTNQFEDGVVYIPSRSFVTDKRNIFPNKNMFFYKGDRIICNELASTGLFRFQETYTITYSGMNPLYTLSDVNVIEVISANRIKVSTSEGLFVGASIIINGVTTRILEVEDNLITVNTSISYNIGDSIKYSYCLYKHDNVTEAGYEPEGADIHNWDRLYQTQRDALLIYKNGWINIDGTQPIKVSII